MKEAILTLKTNLMGLRKLVTTFDVAKDSFRRTLRKLEKCNTGGNTDIIHKQSLDRFRNVFSKSEEGELKKPITDMDRAFYGLTIVVLEYYSLKIVKGMKSVTSFQRKPNLF